MITASIIEKLIFCLILAIGFGMTNWLIKNRLDKFDKRLDDFDKKLDNKIDEKTCGILHGETKEKLKANDQEHGKFFGWLDDLRLWVERQKGEKII